MIKVLQYKRPAELEKLLNGGWTVKSAMGTGNILVMILEK